MSFQRHKKFSNHKSERFNESDKKPFKQPKPLIQTTTLWDFPSQHYGHQDQGDGEYAGVTPSYVIWNLLQRYTKPGWTVLDPMCGSGTTLDVCKDLNRVGIGFDLAPNRKDIGRADARRLPLKDASVDFVFIDPPYSTHIKYSGDPACIGELDARGGEYYKAMESVLAEIYRTAKDGAYVALYIQDSFAKGKPFAPLGFEMFLRMSALMDPVDIMCVTRHNKKLKRNHWHTSAIEGNFFLRGFNYLFVFQKNLNRNASGLKHDNSGSLSYYFQQVAKARPGEVVTPETLAQAIDRDRDSLDRKLVRKESKKSFKEAKLSGQSQSSGGGRKDAKGKPNNRSDTFRKGR